MNGVMDLHTTRQLFILSVAFILVYLWKFFLCPNVKIRVSGCTVGEPPPAPFFPLVIWVSEWFLLNTNSAIFQLYHGENKLIFNEMMMMFALFSSNKLSWNFIVLVHWNNSLRVDMSLHSNTLSWFLANQSLLFLFNDACLAEKQQIPIL